MWPTLVEGQQGFAIHSYGLLVLCAFAASTLLVAARAHRMGLAIDRLPAAALVAALGGFPSAKLLDVLTTGGLASLTNPAAGFAWYGGILGGGLAVALAARPLGLPVWKLADATAPAIALGAGIGRVGCFMAGCCHGVPVPEGLARTPLLAEGTLHGQLWSHPAFPWLSTSFDGGAATILGVPLYPTQLWQSAGSFLLVAVLLALSAARRFDGQVAAAWLILDPLLRAFVESFRGDERGYAVSWEGLAPSWLPGLGAAQGEGLVGLTTSQGIGLLLVLAGIAVWVVRRNAGVAPEVVKDAWVDDLVDDEP